MNDKPTLDAEHSVVNGIHEVPQPHSPNHRPVALDDSAVPGTHIPGELFGVYCMPNCREDENTSIFNCMKCGHAKRAHCKPRWVEALN